MNHFFELCLFSSLIFMSLYQLALFSFQREDRFRLYFSLVALFLSLGVILPILPYGFRPLPSMVNEHFGQIFLLFLLLSLSLYLLLLESLFPEVLLSVYTPISLGAGPVLAAAAWFTPSQYYGVLTLVAGGFEAGLFLVFIFPLWKAGRNKRKGAVLSLFAHPFLAATFIRYTALALNYQRNPSSSLASDIVLLGSFLFLVCFSHVMVLKSTESRIRTEEQTIGRASVEKIKDEFVANSLNELTIPLKNLTKNSELLLGGVSGNLNPIQASNLNMVLSASQRLEKQVTELIEKLGFENMTAPSGDQPYSLQRTVEHVFELCLPLIKGKRLQLRNEISGEFPQIGAAENRVRQILFNLLDSIIKHSSNGMIKVSADSVPDQIQIRISVTGGAIPKRKLDAAFHTIDRTAFLSNPDLDATDLELSIVKSLVESFGGSIWTESEPSKKFTVLINLPANPQIFSQQPGKSPDLMEPSMLSISESTPTEPDLAAQNESLKQINDTLQGKIRELNLSLEQNHRQLENLGAQITRIEKSRRHLLSNISHDLRSPMTSVLGYVEALLDGLVEDPKKQREYLMRVHNKVMGLNHLTEDLFRLTQLEARQIQLATVAIPVTKILRQQFDKFMLDVTNSNIEFNCLIPPEFTDNRPRIWVDPNHFDRVFSNLIGNAVKFTPPGGQITLSCESSGADILFKVTDTGPGISELDLPYIFDRFYMGSKSRTSPSGGSGLGLAIAREIIEYHGGTIWCESKPQAGCTILFIMPADRDAEPS